MFASNVLNNKCFRKMKHALCASTLWKNVILWAISRREISPLKVIFQKKLIKLHGGLPDVTTNIYLKSCAYHPESECCTFFHGNLSDPKSSVTLLYLYVIWNMLKSANQSFFKNMYVVTTAWRCISPWGFHRSLQRRREMDIFGYISRFLRILSKKQPKKEENLNWTLVHTGNLREEIAACQRQYYM